MNEYPFIKCINPQKIVNPHTKEPLLVGCGKCEACLMQKSSMRSLKCKLESKSHKYTYFVTLTYSNEYVPLMQPYLPDGQLWKPKREYYFIDMCPRNDGYRQEIISTASFTLSQLDKLQRKCNLGECLPYLNKRDAQLFMKRLRKYLSKYSDEKLRYYLVGEIGPVHFRPHFHLMLWFSSEAIQEKIIEAVCSCWTFGRIDCDLSQGDCANYVAGYLNSNSYIPRVFKEGKCKPFASHSRFLGESFLRSKKEEVYSLPVREFIERSDEFNGTYTKFSLWRSLKTAFYPRCPKYATFTHAERLRSYRTYAEASEICGKISPLQQARLIVESIFNGKNMEFPLLPYLANKYLITPYMSEQDFQKSVRRVYMELRTSEHFLNFVCNSDNVLEQETKLTMIERFYDALELLNLGDSYIMQDEYFKFDAYDLDDLNFFYDTQFFDAKKFKELPVYRQFKENQINKHKDSVKHKELNDKNLIFNY